jgi:hypothetical protein
MKNTKNSFLNKILTHLSILTFNIAFQSGKRPHSEPPSAEKRKVSCVPGVDACYSKTAIINGNNTAEFSAELYRRFKNNEIKQQNSNGF